MLTVTIPLPWRAFKLWLLRRKLARWRAYDDRRHALMVEKAKRLEVLKRATTGIYTFGDKKRFETPYWRAA